MRWPGVWACLQLLYSLAAKVPEKSWQLFFPELSTILEQQWPTVLVFQPSAPKIVIAALAPSQHTWPSLGPGPDSKCSKKSGINKGTLMFIARVETLYAREEARSPLTRFWKERAQQYKSACVSALLG